jgi:glycosyltransferase involved in cell wall biosynthesis
MRGIIPERYGRGTVRALVVSNMLPDARHPERGRFVRDQVAALRRLDGVEVELHEFAPGPPALATAALALRRRYAWSPSFDVVHAHFGLAAWPALAVPARVRALTVHGTDVHHPLTRLATAAVLGMMDLLAAASADLAAELPTRAARRRAVVLPCGVDTERFQPLERERAREQLGRPGQQRMLLFPADPARHAKRHDRAVALARAAGAELLTLGGVDPERVPLLVNAADAVVVPSEREGFGLAVLEALACEVPVIATPVGIHPQALEGIDGCLCAPFQLDLWLSALEPLLREPRRLQGGRAAAGRYATVPMAERVRDAWSEALRRSGSPAG